MKQHNYLHALSIATSFENMDSSNKTFADAVRGQCEESNSWWRSYQVEDEEEAMVIAMEKSRKIVKVFIVSFCLVRNVGVNPEIWNLLC